MKTSNRSRKLRQVSRSIDSQANIVLQDKSVFSGIAIGSRKKVVGEICLIGGGWGIVDNIKIESKVRINPMTYVTKSIKKPGTYSGGSIVLEHSKWLRHITIQKKRFDD